MPCNCDYMNPTQSEKNSRLTAEHLVFVYGKLDKDVPEYIMKASNHIYGDKHNLNKMVMLLCETLRGLDDEQKDSIIYNGRDRQSRSLANWWEDHCVADANREAQEKKDN